MKILLVTKGTEVGGIAVSLLDFIDYLVSKGYEVDLISFDFTYGHIYQELKAKVNIVDRIRPLVLSELRLLKIGKGLLLQSAWYLVYKLFQGLGIPWKIYRSPKSTYDVAISYGNQRYSDRYVIDKVCSKKKLLWYHHGVYEPNRGQYKKDKKCFCKYNAIVAVSESCAKHLKDKLDDLTEIVTINNIINDDKIRNKGLIKDDNSREKKDLLNIVTVGRLTYEKGIDIAIETAKVLRDKGIEFVWQIVGDGIEKDSLSKLIKRYQLNEHILLVGEKENPYLYVADADIYVQTSRIEAHPLTIIEAIVLNKVIIASHIQANVDILQNGELGVTVPLDPTKIANHIEQCSINQELREQYIEATKKMDISKLNQITFKRIGDIIEME